MPPRRKNEDELSLRHLPDTSYDLSFQIPNGLSSSDLLLCNDDMSFFRDTDDAYPHNLKISGRPMTPSNTLKTEESTPKPKPKPIYAATSPQKPVTPILTLDMSSNQIPRNSEQLFPSRESQPAGKQKPDLKITTRVSQPYPHTEGASSTATRLYKLHTEVQMSHNNTHDAATANSPKNHVKALQRTKAGPPDSKRERSTVKSKRTVISGGILKKRSKNSASASATSSHVPSVPNIGEQILLAPKPQEPSDNEDFGSFELNADTSICSTTDGVAESPFPPENIAAVSTIDPESSQQAFKAIPDHVNVNRAVDQRDTPLTLLEISPSESIFPSTSSAGLVPTSPMQPPTKRPVSVASTQSVAKKGKRAAVTTERKSVINNTKTAHGPPSGSSSGSRDGHATVHSKDIHSLKKSTRHRPTPSVATLENKRQTRVPNVLGHASRSSSSSSTLRFSRSSNLATSASSTRAEEEVGISKLEGTTNRPERHEFVILPPVNSTKAVGLILQPGARIEARKAEHQKEPSGSSQKPRKQNHHVPDFKALHALQEAEIVQRKENIVPVIPLPLELNTEGRAREREKFDEHVREKEREQGQAMEERRREQEENEEREVRELRKKAVPKAHEVPDWYKQVPKKKDRKVDTS